MDKILASLNHLDRPINFLNTTYQSFTDLALYLRSNVALLRLNSGCNMLRHSTLTKIPDICAILSVMPYVALSNIVSLFDILDNVPDQTSYQIS